MRITTIVCILLSVFAYQSTWATGGNPHFGGRSAGIANASVALKDLWSIKHNQAGLAYLRKPQAGIAYENRFGLSELATKAGVLAIPLKKATLGINVSQFGYSAYNENKIGVAVAKKLTDRFSLGVQMNYEYFQFSASEYGQKGYITGEVGILAEVNEALTLGAHLYNPGYTKLSEFEDERIPVILRIGGDYRFSKKFNTLFEIEKDIDEEAQVKLGAEYQAHKKVYLRAGVSTEPFKNAFGVGFNFEKLKIDVSASYHSTLGYSPNISLTYQFK